MKLYRVTVETEIVVVAEDEAGAEDAARQAIDDMGSYDLEYGVQPLRFLPFGWSGAELPWVESDDVPEKTVNQWIDEGAAPELTKRMAEQAAARAARVSPQAKENGDG